MYHVCESVHARGGMHTTTILILIISCINVLVYCHHRAAYVRRSPLQETIPFARESYLVHPQRFTCAAQGNQKNPPSAQEGKRSPAMYAAYFRKHRRTDFFLLYLRLHCVCRQLRACSTQTSTTRYPLSRESLPVSILCEITPMNLVWNHMISYLI